MQEYPAILITSTSESSLFLIAAKAPWPKPLTHPQPVCLFPQCLAGGTPIHGIGGIPQIPRISNNIKYSPRKPGWKLGSTHFEIRLESNMERIDAWRMYTYVIWLGGIIFPSERCQTNTNFTDFTSSKASTTISLWSYSTWSYISFTGICIPIALGFPWDG
jgi:hypothetical protein